MPLRTIASFRSSHAVSGCAYSSVTPPCVAQRVCPRPVVDCETFDSAASFRNWRFPTARTYSRPPSSRSAIPAESYPRYSSRLRPWSSSGLEARLPTYPMIPHIRSLLLYPVDCRKLPPKSLLKTQKPGSGPALRREVNLAELSSDEPCDPTTGLCSHLGVFGLREHPNQGLRAGRPHENAAVPIPVPVHALDLLEDVCRQLLVLHAHVFLALRPARHHGSRLAQPAALEGAAEEQPGGEAVPRHVVAEVDDVSGLLAAEERPFALQRLEHVAVADVGRVHGDAALAHQRVEPEVGHHRDGDLVDLLVEREDRDDLVAVDRLAVLVDREHAVAVTVERDAEVVASFDDGARQEAEIGRTAAHVDVRPVGRVADRVNLGSALLEGLRSESGVGAVRAVDDDAQAVQVRTEALENVLEVRVRRDLDPLDLPLVDARRGDQQLLGLLLGCIGELVAVRVEELDAVVLRWVVRGRDHDPEVEREQGNGRRREDAAEDRVASDRDHPARKRLFELTAGVARIAADEDLGGARPGGGRPSEALHELGCHELAHDAAHPIGAEVPPRHGEELPLAELRRLARLVQAGLLALHDACVTRQEAGALQRHAELRVDLDECTGDPVAHRACLARRAAAVEADAQVVLALEPGRLERRGRQHPVHLAGEIVLDLLAVDPGVAV